MIDTCSEYAEKHNLSFSTNIDPKKCKTMCMAFSNTKKEAPILQMMLNKEPLPWVKTITHLGVKINDKLSRGQYTLEKRAQYVSKCNEMRQEFHFAHPKTLTFLNNTYNSQFYGATLWDLFSKEAERITGTWNTTQRLVFGLPRTTHRYLVEPISKEVHIMKLLWKRFLKFSRGINFSKKPTVRKVFDKVRKECRSVTGRNLRSIMLKTKHKVYTHFDQKFDWKGRYYAMPKDESWRTPIIEELLDAKKGKREITNFDMGDIDAVLQYVCST